MIEDADQVRVSQALQGLEHVRLGGIVGPVELEHDLPVRVVLGEVLVLAQVDVGFAAARAEAARDAVALADDVAWRQVNPARWSFVDGR